MNHATTTATTIATATILWPFVWEYSGDMAPEETLTHSHLSWSSNHPLSPSSIYYDP